MWHGLRLFPMQMSIEVQQLQTAERAYSSQLAELQAMGFSNRQANLRGTQTPVSHLLLPYFSPLAHSSFLSIPKVFS